jgi:hypothetical protein
LEWIGKSKPYLSNNIAHNCEAIVKELWREWGEKELLCRQRKGNGCTLTYFTLRTDVSAVRFHQIFGNRQPQTRAA